MRRLIYSSIILSMVFASIALAVPPTTKYSPGETLTPNCAPGATNCSIVTLATNNSVISEDGTVTIGGTGSTNNENILLNFETVANAIGLTSTTGVLDLIFTGIDLNTTTEVSAENLVSTDDADITDNLTAGDITIDEAAGILQFSGATSASILSDSNVLTIGGVNGVANNENLLFDFETVANAIGASSLTGVLDLTFTGIDLNTTTEVSAEHLVSTDDAVIADNLTVDRITLEASDSTTASTGGIYSENDGFGPYPQGKNVSAHTYTEKIDPASAWQYENFNSTEINFTADPTSFYAYGLMQSMYTSSFYTYNLDLMSAGTFNTWHYGPGTVALAVGSSFNVSKDGAGIITDARAGEFSYGHYATGGTINNASGVYVKSPSSSSEDNVTNGYGVYIEAQDVGALTANRYQLYSAGTSPSYFAGPILKSTTAGITAATGGQGTVPLTSQINEVSTVAVLNDDVTLPTAIAGLCVTVINNDLVNANNLDIWPASEDDLGIGVNAVLTGVSTPGTTLTFCAYDATNWRIT